MPTSPAEFRGPGVHHNYEDSDSGQELDSDNKGKRFGAGGYRGRIIFLGDGTEVLTDSDDAEMFDNADEDKDLESQVSKTSPPTQDDQEASSKPAPAEVAESKSDLAPAPASAPVADEETSAAAKDAAPKLGEKSEEILDEKKD